MEKKIAKRLLIEIIILVIVLIIWSTRPINAYKIRTYFIKMKLQNKPYSIITLNNRRKIKGKIIKENDKSLTLNEEYIFINGTIKYIPLEGGFYGIIADDGKKYDPINLDQNFATDGLKVKVKAKILKDVVSFHMWGEIIKIIKIEPSSPQSKYKEVKP